MRSAMDTSKLTTTSLHRNPFCVLGATLRDNRTRIVELASDRLLDLDNATCQKARSDLTNPRARLSAEMGWLPGVSPGRAIQLVQALSTKPDSIWTETGLPALARANLFIAAFEAIDSTIQPDSIVDRILELAIVIEGEVTIDDVIRDINEDRAVSGFPPVDNSDVVAAQFVERQLYAKRAVRDALDRLPPHTIIEVMTNVVENATEGGTEPGYEFIDALVDTYEVEIHGFLEKEADNIGTVLNAIGERAKSNSSGLDPLIDQLETMVRNWDRAAQPVQLSMKARGLDHDPSNALGYAVRSMAVKLVNERGMVAQGQRITALLREVFAELPELSDRIEQDVDALEGLREQMVQSDEQKAKWARDITYSAEIGMVFKDKLTISPQGAGWKSHWFPLDEITRVRWGALRQSVNGIPTGTTYTIGFGNRMSEAEVNLTRADVYTAFVDKLFKAVGARLITQMLESLRNGNTLTFGNATVYDNRIVFTKRKLLSSEQVPCSWREVQVHSANGSLYISGRGVHVSRPYMYEPNAHLLEQIVSMALKKRLGQLSDLLK